MCEKLVDVDTIYNMNCLDGLLRLEENSVDLVVTSPPYNIGIEYDSWDDKIALDTYWTFLYTVLSRCYSVLKPSGRIAINVLYEGNFKGNGGRVFVAGKVQQLMESAGFKHGGFVDLKEAKAHRVKYSSWGSWLKPSAPYIYCAKECVLIGYKGDWKKEGDKSYAIDKDLFMECVQGEWIYRAETRSRTKACFSEDIPFKAISMLTFPNDVVLDPFMGSGTTAVAAIKLGRKYIGFEISPHYHKVAADRIKSVYDDMRQQTL